MVQRVEVRLEGDLDGGPADGTFPFALEGRNYEIDLCAANIERLREALHPFMRAARRTTTRAGGLRAHNTGGAPSPGENAAIRVWARRHGHPVARGRIPTHIRDVYRSAAGGQP